MNYLPRRNTRTGGYDAAKLMGLPLIEWAKTVVIFGEKNHNSYAALV